MRAGFMIVSLSALGAASVAVAAPIDKAAGAAPVPPSASEKPVCKSQARTGTRFATRICKPRQQWSDEAAQARQDAQDQVNKPQTQIGTGS